MERLVRRVFRTPEAAEYIGVSGSTLEKWRLVGLGPRYCKLGRTVAYDVADLDQWIERSKRSSTSEQGDV
jgi:predicted DNA-binding transcriptional regulator AlpA